MDNPRPDKVAVVNEVRDRLEASDGAVLTEYRGLTVAELAELRRELTAAGGDYKVYKNTLVRLAVADTPRAGVSDLLTGPTAIAFVQGDVSSVAKALRDFARATGQTITYDQILNSEHEFAPSVDKLSSMDGPAPLVADANGKYPVPQPGITKKTEY